MSLGSMWSFEWIVVSKLSQFPRSALRIRLRVPHARVAVRVRRASSDVGISWRETRHFGWNGTWSFPGL